MSEAQRRQLSELLDDIYTHWVDTVAAARGKTQEVRGGRGGGRCPWGGNGRFMKSSGGH
jgi:hypothetical protein